MQNIISETKVFVKSKLKNESTGHDYLHAYRVWKNAIFISKKEKANLYVVQLAALLHDISDWKFNGGDFSKGATIAEDF